MGIRTAFGATPSRLLRMVVTEGFVIAAAAGALALLLAWWTQSLVGTFAIPIWIPSLHARLFIRNVAVPWKNSRKNCVTSSGRAA